MRSPLSDSAGWIRAKDAIATIGFSLLHTARNAIAIAGFSQLNSYDAIATSGVNLFDSYNAIASIEGNPVQFRDKDAITALESKLFDSYDAIANIRVSLLLFVPDSPLLELAPSVPCYAIATAGFSLFHTARDAIAIAGFSQLNSYDAIASTRSKLVKFVPDLPLSELALAVRSMRLPQTKSACSVHTCHCPTNPIGSHC